MGKLVLPRYRITNWPSYNRSLEQWASMLILSDAEIRRLAEPEGKTDRLAVFSDTAIQLCLSLKVLFGLLPRPAAGMVRALLKLAGLDWPIRDHTSLCRRQKILTVQIRYRSTERTLNLLVESIGVNLLGDGEWQVRKHGVQFRVNGASSIWRWIRPLRTFGQWSSPQVEMVTAHCCRNYWNSFSWTKRSATMPATPVGATLPA